MRLRGLRGAGAIALSAALVLGLPRAGLAQVGMTLERFEQISGKPIDRYKAADGTQGLIYKDVWLSETSGREFAGRTAIEMTRDNRVVKEVFYFDSPLPNTPDGATDAVGIGYNLLPPQTPSAFLDSGKRQYEKGWVLWFDYGEGRYLNFFLDPEEQRIEAVVGGVEATSL